jgi:hypothetical protein
LTEIYWINLKKRAATGCNELHPEKYPQTRPDGCVFVIHENREWFSAEQDG